MASVLPQVEFSPRERAGANRRLAMRLGLVAVAATGFGFALVPLYDVLCRVTGLNGKTNSVAAPTVRVAVDTSRTVSIEFMATSMPGAPVVFEPMQASVQVHPGEITLVNYRVRNLSGESITTQSVPSVSPGGGAAFFNKIDCFCFKQQVLAPGEVKDMPLTFVVNPELPEKLATLTLSYAMYSLGHGAGDQQPQKSPAVREGGGA